MLDVACGSGLVTLELAARGLAVTGTDLRAARDGFEKACIERALEENGDNRTHAAKALGISLRSLQQKLKQHGVS